MNPLQHAALERTLTEVITGATSGRWRLVRCWRERECLLIEVGDPPLVVEVRAAVEGARAYQVVGAFAFSYRSSGGALSRERQALLARAVAALGRALDALQFDPAQEPPSAHDADAPFPTPYQRAHLETPRPLAPELIADYLRDGHVLVRRALHPDVVRAAHPRLLAALERARPTDLPPADERVGAYAQAFTQITDLWSLDPAAEVFSLSRRVAQMAAELMGVSSVRVFCEDWLIKEPGARATPWHQDEAVFPFDAEATITCWIPLQDVRPIDGLLRFARGSQRLGVAPIEDISDTSEAEFAAIIAKHGLPIDELPSVYVGDVSFHDGRTIHGAYANTSNAPRVVLALHCFADGARIKAPTTPRMAQVLAGSAPLHAVGDVADSARWPLVFDATTPIRENRAVVRPRLGGNFHLRATLLPHGDAPTDLWIADGRLRFSPVADAVELAPAGGFLCSGLVDAHCHISYPHDREMRVETAEWMNARRAEHAATGVLVLRDMGAVDDAICTLLDIPGLPRVQAAGNMIVRFDEFPFTRTDPSQLVAACIERIGRGARWVKIFADWSSDYRGRVNAGFTGDDELTYSLELLREAVGAVHALGGRVATHAFTHAGAEVAIRAGVDSLEHGWGLDDALLDEMAARDVTWVPLVGIAAHMWRVALGEAQDDRAQWVEECMARLARLLPRAAALGVRVLAGTDMFPDVTIGDEIAQLHALGLPHAAALAAGTDAARAYLGEPGLVEGAPADLVLYRDDPRVDLTALLRPERIVIGGVMVAPSLAHVRPYFAEWAERAASSTPR